MWYLPSLLGSPILSDSPDAAVAEVSDSPSAVVSSDVPDCSSRRGFHGYPGPVPRWRLAREGRFLRERIPSGLDCFGDGCSLCAVR